ncbi:MAG: hypothetical protein A2365_00795 [Candidatus Nealsonbacteria bacterium RIFOXYB1_FULL_40_15]|uniref:CYTH domain-containing protein n=2 Tax=Candidatus Nealsoniibacteriota TaxID=1817911 RepID=A0A1G2ERR9_9BACT|nr:MAG: hypothetical protein A2365_00795 [Candidatus Nealsonbacteria bacterium RIFOXYB1_FULL_40_15]OGZ28061.1 MAG: hypothetical protein A2427_03275 [Candidatus Nealsonbacteria bacterium RIFOXYC1_FULL_40_7]OGZ28522.1 MAG: hypothetical protein A2562_03485 [Candidatus Nealsonbacteria bacterium RIFOXYD1_FULL_39_11]
MCNKEIEVKFNIDNKDKDLVKKIRVLGAKKKFSQFQRTCGFFKPNFENIKEGIFPRLRLEGNRYTLGIKSKIKDKKYFKRKEFECHVADPETIIKIFKTLGWTKIIIFEKIRSEWKLDKFKATICFDTLPWGKYLEIEANPDKIELLIKKLNLKSNERITSSYLGVYEDWCKNHNIKPKQNIVFRKKKML